MIRQFCLGLALTLSACVGQSASEEPTDVPAETEVRFSDVLAEYQALNTRLDTIAAPLLKANAELCPRISRDIGVTVHTLADYPIELQPVAQSLMGVTHDLTIRTVRDGSEAANAGLLPGDRILKIGDRAIRETDDPQLYYTAVSQLEYAANNVDINVLRNNKIVTAQLSPETICGYPVIVFFSENMNGHTDGKEVWITSELLRRVPDDVNLALIVSHELAHAIAGHMEKRPSKALELEADRIALVLMARAGYDIDHAISYWKRSPHPYKAYQTQSKTHPSIDERYRNFNKVKARIIAQQEQDETILLRP